MNHTLLHGWAREEALPLPSRTHPQNQKQTSVVYTEELTDLAGGQVALGEGFRVSLYPPWLWLTERFSEAPFACHHS